MDSYDLLFEGIEPEELTLEEVCARIEKLTTSMMDFWKSAHGWAPVVAAGLLSRSMLEEQASLSASLGRWVDSTSPGDLILAWANLGALVEGQLKLLLSVYLSDYKKTAALITDADGKRVYANRPDKMMLAKLQEFCDTNVWRSGDPWDQYVERVRRRRNAIHAFQHKDIGTFAEWEADVRSHLDFVRYVNSRLPYPSEEYEPRDF